MLQISAYPRAQLYTYSRACSRVHVYTHNTQLRAVGLRILFFSRTIAVRVDDDTLAIVRRTEGIDIIRQTVAVVIFRTLHAIQQAIAIAIEIEIVWNTIFVCIIGTTASKRCPGLPTTTLYLV
jgi:hypothetical protein